MKLSEFESRERVQIVLSSIVMLCSLVSLFCFLILL